MEVETEKENELPQVILLAELKSILAEYLPNDQLQQVEQAYQVASEAHHGQYRLSGEDYICHPVSVAIILSHMKMDVDCIMAALMHDVLEDTETTFEELATLFNEDVAGLVDAVSKLTKINFNALASFFNLGYIPSNESIYENTMQVPPGHYFIINSKGKIKKKCYWDIERVIKKSKNDFNGKNINFESNLEELINNSVKNHMVSDVPLGSFLSGGIDSSLISLFMQKNSDN